MSKFGHEKERALRSVQQLRDKMAVLELAESQRVKLERENSHLAAELENFSGLQVTRENYHLEADLENYSGL